MEEKEKNDEKDENGSNLCVKDLSIDAEKDEKDNEDNDEGGTQILNRSFDNKENFTKKLNLKDNFENILDLIEFEEENKARSRTIAIRPKKPINK